MAHDFELERTALHALGTLPDAESCAAEGHIAECAECLREYINLHEIASAVALSVEAGDEHELRLKRIKHRVLAAVEHEKQAPRASTVVPRDTWYRALAVASITIALGATLWAGTLISKLQASETALRDSKVRAYSALVDAGTLRSRLSVILAPDAQVSQVATGLIVKRADRLYLAMNKLPELPPHHRFQVWLAVTGKKDMQPSILFANDREGTAFLALPAQATAVQAIALSIEPENGSLQPTTTPLFVHPLI